MSSTTRNIESLLPTLALAVSAVLLAACEVQTYEDAAAGFNDGMPNLPQDPDEPPPVETLNPVYSEIQAKVFSQDCATAGCHSGANPPASLNLEAGNAHAMLVGVPSTQQPATMRVAAGNPNASYLIQKLEGAGGAGIQMPPNNPMEQADIDAIRQWITDGAVDDTLVVAGPIRVTGISPAHNATLDSGPTQIVAGFDRDLDTSTVNDMTFILTAGTDGIIGNGNDVQVAATSISVPGSNQASARFDLSGMVLADDAYEITLSGTGASVIMDLDANALDGEFSGSFPSGNGTAGGTFRSRFTVETPVVLGPNLADIQALVFATQCASCHTGAGATLPGSLNLTSEAASYAALVNVDSTQDANLKLVLPGDAANSYLIHKFEGTNGATRMPPSGPLPQATIDTIKLWINNGANP